MAARRFIALLSLLPAFALASPSTDDTLLANAEQERSAFLETLESLVNLDSGTGDVDDLARVEALLQERLVELGFEVEQHPAEAFGGNTLVARHQGSGDADLMLMIHYDTVFSSGTVAKRPFSSDDSRAYGPGVGDAKGGIAVILHSLGLLDDLELSPWGTLTVVFNPDEEKGSFGSRELIAELASEQDAVLSFEPTLGKPGESAVTTVTKGINYAFLEVEGRASHAGGAPEEGRNAVMELAHQLLQLDDLGDSDKGTTLNWTIVEGGTKRNIIPDSARAEGDMRYFDHTEYERVMAEAQSIIAEQRVTDTEVAFRLERGRPPLPPNPATEQLAALAQSIYRQELDQTLALAEIGGGTDAGYAYDPETGQPAVLESLGLVGGRYHSDEEFIELDSIVPRLYLTTRLIQELSGPSAATIDAD